MTSLPLIFTATSDLAGKMRGKAFPAGQLPRRKQTGVGWTPTNVMINCFDVIGDWPFGALGDLMLVPDPTTEVRVDFGHTAPDHFMLGDVTELDGSPWALCTRAILRGALGRLYDLAGVHLLAAFEHEFQLLDDPIVRNQAYGLEAFQTQRDLCETLMGALQSAGIHPDSIMKEYGPNQYEVVVGHERGLRAADIAAILRELTRSAARSVGERATFSPILDVDNVGNGVHVHMSFESDGGDPVGWDRANPFGMSEICGSFAAGVLAYLESIVALTAPSVVSYRRLTPHRWSAAYNNLGYRDREAALRICPVWSTDPAKAARQFNIEFRAADAAASPHLALAAIVHAGCQGIEDHLPMPVPTQEDLSTWSSDALVEHGLVRLPQTLPEALDRFSANDTVTGWFTPPFATVYRAHKLSEITHVEGLDDSALCAAYRETY